MKLNQLRYSLGAIIGSMLFNTLGVAASASLFTKKPIQIDWWPITRDSILLSINIGILVTFTWDGVVMWWETMILVVLYVCYWITMFQNPRVMKFMKRVVEDKLMWCQRIKNYDIINQRPKDPQNENGSANAPKPETGDNRESYVQYRNEGFDGSSDQVNAIEAAKARGRRQSFDLSRIDEVEEEEFNVFEIPRGASYFDFFWFFFTWPIRFLLHITIPNPIKHKKWFPLSFLMCIVWIAVVAYVIFWMVVVIGDTFGIPEPIMGFTLLAFGGCMPEAISAVIVARKGSGQMGVSNALGANSLAVLFSLGLPWFIRTMADGAWTKEGGSFIKIASEGIEYTILSLILAVASLYLTIAIAGYKLRKTVGGILALLYLIFATLAVLSELGIIFGSPITC
jgi:Ca2+/Na+ antiporter